MPSVTLSANDYETYADVDEADIYLEADPGAAAWRAAEADDKARALVSATRILDRQRWAGSKTDEDQALAWPRSGISGLDEDEVPQAVADACCELASALINGYDAANLQSTANATKRQKAGSVEIEYFRGAEGDGLRLPLPVMELVGLYLGGTTSLAGSFASGTCGDSFTSGSFEPNQP